MCACVCMYIDISMCMYIDISTDWRKVEGCIFKELYKYLAFVQKISVTSSLLVL